MLFHSLRARSGTKRQVNAWIKEIEKGIKSREKELKKFKILAPLTPSDWDDKMIPELELIIKKYKKRLQEYIILKKKYEKDGLI